MKSLTKCAKYTDVTQYRTNLQLVQKVKE